MRFLTAEEIANPTELTVIEVPTPELGEETGVRMMEPGAMARARISNQFGEEGVQGEKVLLFYAELLCETLVDEERNRMFTTADDVKAFCERDYGFLFRLGEEASKLARYSGDESNDDELKN